MTITPPTTTPCALQNVKRLRQVLPPEAAAAAEWFPCQAADKSPRYGWMWKEPDNRGTLDQLAAVLLPDEVCGLALGESAPFTIIDLDRVLAPDGHLHSAVEPLVREALVRGAFVERSISGKGLHIITQRLGLHDANSRALGQCSVCGATHDEGEKTAHLEWWSGRDGAPMRYVVLTGDCYQFCAEGAPLVSAAGTLFEMLVPYAAKSSATRGGSSGKTAPPDDLTAEIDDDELEALRGRARQILAGKRFNSDALLGQSMLDVFENGLPSGRHSAAMQIANVLLSQLDAHSVYQLLWATDWVHAAATKATRSGEDWFYSYIMRPAIESAQQRATLREQGRLDAVEQMAVAVGGATILPFTRATVASIAAQDAPPTTTTPTRDVIDLGDDRHPHRRFAREVVHVQGDDKGFIKADGGTWLRMADVQREYEITKAAVDDAITAALQRADHGDGIHTIRVVQRVVHTWAMPWGVQPDPLFRHQRVFNTQRMHFHVAPSADDLWQVEYRLAPLLSIWQRVYGEQLSVVLDYLAMLVQHPNLRLSKMLLLQGSTGGEGKTLLKGFLDAVFGTNGVASISQGKLTNDATFAGASLDAARVAFIDELVMTDTHDPQQRREIGAVTKFIMEMTGQSSSLISVRRMRAEAVQVPSSVSLIATTNCQHLFDLSAAGMNRRVIPIIARNPHYQPLRGVSKAEAALALRREYAPVLARMGLREGVTGSEQSQAFRDLLALLLARPTDHLSPMVCDSDDPRIAAAFDIFNEAHRDAQVGGGAWERAVAEAVAALGAAEGVDIITVAQRKRLLAAMAPEGWDSTRPVPRAALTEFKRLLREVYLSHPLPKTTRAHCTSLSMRVGDEEWLLDSESGLYRNGERTINSRDAEVSVTVRAAVERTERWLVELERTHKPSVEEAGTTNFFG